PHIERQLVLMAEQQRLAIAADHELRRDRAVERPDRIQVLGWEAGMELQRNRGGRIDARIELWRDLRVIDRIGLRSLLGGPDRDSRWIGGEALMGPDRSAGAAFDRSGISGDHAFQRRVEKLLSEVVLRR